MKIAVLSDIHGNMEAIDAVFADIKNENCDKIFVLGDYAMAGPEPDRAIDYFMLNKDNLDLTLIQGNTDLMIVNYSIDVYKSLREKAPVMAEALNDDYKLINIKQRNFLKNLPPQKQLQIDGVKILLVHGSPRKNDENILPNTSLAEIEKMTQNIDADMILCGHTHIPCGFQTPTGKTVINVGSIGRPFTPEPKSCYLKLTISNGQTLCEHKFVKYNNERAALKIQKRMFLGANKLANNLLNPELRHF